MTKAEKKQRNVNRAKKAGALTAGAVVFRYKVAGRRGFVQGVAKAGYHDYWRARAAYASGKETAYWTKKAAHLGAKEHGYKSPYDPKAIKHGTTWALHAAREGTKQKIKQHPKEAFAIGVGVTAAAGGAYAYHRYRKTHPRLPHQQRREIHAHQAH